MIELKAFLRKPKRVARSKIWTSRLRSRGVVVGRNLSVNGGPRVKLAVRGSIVLKDDVTLTSKWTSNDLDCPGPCVLRTLTSSAVIEVGSESGLSGVTISAAQRVVIGERVLIGAGAVITDSDHHHVRLPDVALRRKAGRPAPKREDAVEISNDVFIGARAIVLKGSRIGEGAVIGAGSVVSGRVEPRTIIAGNPARVVGHV